MQQPVCLEDFYDYRVNKIFAALRQEHAEADTKLSFEKWLNSNKDFVADTFLEDVETYMGIPEPGDDD